MWSDEEEWDFDAYADEASAEQACQADEEFGMERVDESHLMDAGLLCLEDAPVAAIAEISSSTEPPAIAHVAEPVAATEEPVETTPDGKRGQKRRRHLTKTPAKEAAWAISEIQFTDSETVFRSSQEGSTSAQRELRLRVPVESHGCSPSPANLMRNLEPVALPISDAEWWMKLTISEKHRWNSQKIRVAIVEKFRQHLAAAEAR